jgi:hypothetical protein
MSALRAQPLLLLPRCESDWRAAHTFPASVAGRPLTARPGQSTRAEHCTKSRSRVIASAWQEQWFRAGASAAVPVLLLPERSSVVKTHSLHCTSARLSAHFPPEQEVPSEDDYKPDDKPHAAMPDRGGDDEQDRRHQQRERQDGLHGAVRDAALRAAVGAAVVDQIQPAAENAKWNDDAGDGEQARCSTSPSREPVRAGASSSRGEPPCMSVV